MGLLMAACLLERCCTLSLVADSLLDSRECSVTIMMCTRNRQHSKSEVQLKRQSQAGATRKPRATRARHGPGAPRADRRVGDSAARRAAAARGGGPPGGPKLTQLPLSGGTRMGGYALTGPT